MFIMVRNLRGFVYFMRLGFDYCVRPVNALDDYTEATLIDFNGICQPVVARLVWGLA